MYQHLASVTCLRNKEAYALSGLMSYGRRYWRKAIERKTTGEVIWPLNMHVKSHERNK